MKCIYCFVIILSSLNADGQKRPVSLSVTGIRENSHEKEIFKICGEVLVSKGDTILFDPVTYTSELMCDLGVIGLDFERLENDCYQSTRPDCHPVYPLTGKPVRQVEGDNRYVFEYDISTKFNKKRHTDGRLTLTGAYRFRVTFRYLYQDKPYAVKSEWQYVSFN